MEDHLRNLYYRQNCRRFQFYNEKTSSTVEQTELNLGLQDTFQLSYSCPLGDRKEDIDAWNDSHGKDSPDPRQTVFNFGHDDLPLFRHSNNSRRLEGYTKKAVSLGGVIPLKELIIRAGKKIPLGKSQKSKDKWIQYIKNCGKFYVYKIRKGRSFILMVRSKTRIKIHTHPLKKAKERINNKHAGAKTKNYIPSIKNLSFAIIKGRKPLEGFGRKFCQNDDDWITLESFHWDNCKVKFIPKLLFPVIYELLTKRIPKQKILAEYERLLHIHHGYAVDDGRTKTDWMPFGIIKELKQINS